MAPDVTVSCVTNTSRYLAGLGAAALGMCAGGWLILTPYAFGYPARGRAAVTALATGGGLAVVCAGALICWAVLWRRKLRADGVLPARPVRPSRRSLRRQERAERLIAAARQRELDVAPDPAQVLTDLRTLLTPLLPDTGVKLVPAPAEAPVDDAPLHEDSAFEVPAPRVPAHEFAEHEFAEHEFTGDQPATAVAVAEPVEVPGHLRGTRSAAFLASPRPPAELAPLAGPADAPVVADLGGPADSLMRGAELLMVGTGEEEAWLAALPWPRSSWSS
jgi:hypothetical protein